MLSPRENECLDASNECASACLQCALACLQQTDAWSLLRSITLDMQCADICHLAALSIAGHDRDVDEVCRVCADACRSCGSECARHLLDPGRGCTAIFRRCAEACRRCAEAFRGMAEDSVQRADLAWSPG